MPPRDLTCALHERVLLADGAMGTMLLARGLRLGESAAAWVLERPDEVLAVHRAYVEAGAELVTTCTFLAKRFDLEPYGLAARSGEIQARAVELARRAAGPERWVLGDLGPSLRALPPRGDASEDELAQAYGEQAQALVEAGADLLLVETQTDLAEAGIAANAARETGTPWLLSLTFGAGEAEPRTLGGGTLTEAVGLARQTGAAAIGANCMLRPRAMQPLVEALVAAAGELPVLARPNAGDLPPDPPEDFARGLHGLVAAGARLVGGCCGTTPAHIAAARSWLART